MPFPLGDRLIDKLKQHNQHSPKREVLKLDVLIQREEGPRNYDNLHAVRSSSGSSCSVDVVDNSNIVAIIREI